MKLNYKRMGSGEPLIIIHGLFGMLDNWVSFGRQYAKNFDVILVDARNHGHSPHDAEHSYNSMKEDLYELMTDLNLHEASIHGHSMGGKIAMKFAQNYPNMVKKLIVADIAPKAYPVHHSSIIQALRNVPLQNLEKRTDADEYLAKLIPEEGVRFFLAKSLYRNDSGYAWRFNLDAIESNIEIIGEAICDRPYFGETLFIYGEKSNYVQQDEFDEIKTIFPEAHFVGLPNAGHWLHVEQAEMFMKETLAFLLED